MSAGCIEIGIPYIETQGDMSYLKADVLCGKEVKTLSYGVDAEYAQYLVTERSDAFVVALVYYALVKEVDITWKAPCNRQLIYQLQTYFIPVYSSEFEWAHDIKLIGSVTDEELPCTRGGIATGLSNGVDSTYTVKKYLEADEAFRLTHVLFTDCFATDCSESFREDFRKNYLSILPECADELGLKFVFVEFHPDIDFSIGHIMDKKRGVIQDAGLYTLKYCSMAMALNKLLKIYYFSAADFPADFSFDKNDMAYHDLFTIPLLSTVALQFYSAGMETSRLGKVGFIADWGYAQKYLQVCAWDNDTNCGHCSKCLRTMSELDVFGKLEAFSARFPVGDYRTHYAKRMGKVLMEKWKGHVHEVDLLREMRKKQMPIPVLSYFWGGFYTVVDFFRVKLRTNKAARKIYRKYKLDKLLHGRSTEDYSVSVDREILGSDFEGG